jgi:hypothetical protein
MATINMMGYFKLFVVWKIIVELNAKRNVLAYDFNQ